MARLTTGEKAERVVGFIVGMRQPAAAAAMKRAGFTDEDLVQGLMLMAGITQGRLSNSAAVDPDIVAQVEASENRWYPVIEAVLKSNFPDAHEAVFRNLPQTIGAEVIISVGMLLDRIAAQPDEVRALLAKRMVTSDMLADARAMVDTIRALPNTDHVVQAEQDEKAVHALWAW